MLRPRTEWPLVLFTVLVQAAAGTCVIGAVVGDAEPVVALQLLVAGGAAAALHLGRPGAARFALSNLRSSWLSREMLLGAVFGAAIVVHLATRHPAAGIAAAVTGLLLVFAISRIYMIRTVPAWNTWVTPVAFLGTTVLLGAAFHGLKLPAAVTTGILLILTFLHLGRLARQGGAAAVSAATVRDRHRTLLTLRVVTALAGAGVLFLGGGWAVAGACTLLLASEMLGRFLFYASHRRVGL